MSHAPQQLDRPALPENNKLPSAKKPDQSTMQMASSSSGFKCSITPLWQSVGQSADFDNGRHVGHEARKGTRRHRDTDSSAGTQPEFANLQSFSTYRPSMGTNVTTPDRTSLCKPATIASAIAAREHPNIRKQSMKREVSHALSNVSCAAVRGSPERHLTPLSVVASDAPESRTATDVPGNTTSSEHYQTELSRLENGSKDVQANTDSYQAHQYLSSEHKRRLSRGLRDLRSEDTVIEILDDYRDDLALTPQYNDTMHLSQGLLTPNGFSRAGKSPTNSINRHPSNELMEHPAVKIHRISVRSNTLSREAYPCSPSPARQSDMHECIWRRLFLEEQRSEYETEKKSKGSEGVVAIGMHAIGMHEKSLETRTNDRRMDVQKKDLGFKGLTLVVHRDSAEDLVLVCDL